MKSSSNWDVFSNHLKPFLGRFCDNAHQYRLFTYQYFKFYSLFLSWSFMYLLLAFTYQWIAWHISLLILFQLLITYRHQKLIKFIKIFELYAALMQTFLAKMCYYTLVVYYQHTKSILLLPLTFKTYKLYQ